MKNSELSLLVTKKSLYSHEISEFDFRIQNSTLYVLDKVTKKSVYIIVDIESDKITLSLSLAKCLISQKIKERKVYYTCNELVEKFTKKRRHEFTPKDVYEKRKSEDVENTTSINHILNFYASIETSKLNFAS